MLLFVDGFPLGSAEGGPNLLWPRSGQHLKQCKQRKALSPSLPFLGKLVFFPLPPALYSLYHSPFFLSLAPGCKSTIFLRVRAHWTVGRQCVRTENIHFSSDPSPVSYLGANHDLMLGFTLICSFISVVKYLAGGREWWGRAFSSLCWWGGESGNIFDFLASGLFEKCFFWIFTPELLCHLMDRGCPMTSLFLDEWISTCCKLHPLACWQTIYECLFVSVQWLC